MKKFVYAALLLVLVIALVLWLSNDSDGDDPLDLSGDTMEAADQSALAMYSSGFQPQSLTIFAGDTIEVRSVDGEEHRFIIDELNIGVAVPPRTLKTISFSNASPGTYTFYNDRFDLDGAPVSGTLIIQ